MVRLRRKSPWGMPWGFAEKSFNPTMVRLRPLPGRIYKGVLCFNPTMVRLRRSVWYGGCDPSNLFQSRYGAIATLAKSSRREDMLCFNPTMVRLRLEIPLENALNIIAFQSHYGAIAT